MKIYADEPYDETMKRVRDEHGFVVSRVLDAKFIAGHTGTSTEAVLMAMVADELQSLRCKLDDEGLSVYATIHKDI